MIFITYIVCVWSIVAPSVVELDFLVKLLHNQRLKALHLQKNLKLPLVDCISCLLQFLLHESSVSKGFSRLVSLFHGFLPLPRQNSVP